MEYEQTTYWFHSWFDRNETRLVIEERQISEVPVGGLVSGCGGRLRRTAGSYKFYCHRLTSGDFDTYWKNISLRFKS
jgi:hypothetical protein